jgi:hypothetical protein
MLNVQRCIILHSLGKKIISLFHCSLFSERPRRRIFTYASIYKIFLWSPEQVCLPHYGFRSYVWRLDVTYVILLDNSPLICKLTLMASRQNGINLCIMIQFPLCNLFHFHVRFFLQVRIDHPALFNVGEGIQEQDIKKWFRVRGD